MSHPAWSAWAIRCRASLPFAIGPARLLLIVGIAHFFFLLFLGLTRHWSYLTSGVDLGAYDQSLWGVLNGEPFLNTIHFDGPINRLGFHFNPILFLLSPLYALHSAAEWLILTQALAISITAWPLYVLGVRVLSSEHAAMLWALTYLLSPFVLNAGAWDFQSITLAAPLMVGGMLALELGRPRLLLATCVLLLLVREHFGAAVIGLGILWWLRQRSRLPAVVVIVVGIVGLLVVLGLIMPALSPTGTHVMMSQDLGHLSRYGWLGTSLGEIAQSLFLSPIDTMASVFLEFGGWFYVMTLLVPLAAVPLFGAEFLLPAVADLAANLLSANPMPRKVWAYHSIALIPLLVIAGMHGARRLSRLERYTVEGLGRLALFASLLMTYWLLPISVPGSRNIWQQLEYRMWPEEALAEIRALLPPTVSVSAQSNVAPHFTQRGSIKIFPNGLGKADCLVLHFASPTGRIDEGDPGEVGGLAHHLQVAPAVYLAAVRDVVALGEYGPKYSNGAWHVLCRDAEMGDDDRQELFSKLDDLAWQWGVSASPESVGPAVPARRSLPLSTAVALPPFLTPLFPSIRSLLFTTLPTH